VINAGSGTDKIQLALVLNYNLCILTDTIQESSAVKRQVLKVLENFKRYHARGKQSA
jgi:hypothetical protein